MSRKLHRCCCENLAAAILALIQLVAYQRVYGSQDEIRQNTIAKGLAGDPRTALQFGTYRIYSVFAGLAKDFCTKRSIPMPIAVAAATGMNAAEQSLDLSNRVRTQ